MNRSQTTSSTVNTPSPGPLAQPWCLDFPSSSACDYLSPDTSYVFSGVFCVLTLVSDG